MFGNNDKKNKRLSKRGVAIRGMKAGKAIANALSPTGGSDTPEVDSGALYVDKGGSKYDTKPKEDPVAAPASSPNSSKVNSESGSNSAMSINRKKNKRTRYA